MDGLAWWASLLSTTRIGLNTCIPPRCRDRIYSVCRQISVSCLLRADYKLLLFFFPHSFGFFPTLRIFQLEKFICKLINDRHLTPRYEKMRAYCSFPANRPLLKPLSLWKKQSPQSPQGCWPLELAANFPQFQRVTKNTVVPQTCTHNYFSYVCIMFSYVLLIIAPLGLHWQATDLLNTMVTTFYSCF